MWLAFIRQSTAIGSCILSSTEQCWCFVKCNVFVVFPFYCQNTVCTSIQVFCFIFDQVLDPVYLIIIRFLSGDMSLYSSDALVSVLWHASKYRVIHVDMLPTRTALCSARSGSEYVLCDFQPPLTLLFMYWKYLPVLTERTIQILTMVNIKGSVFCSTLEILCSDQH
jgi:hypothetical protein